MIVGSLIFAPNIGLKLLSIAITTEHFILLHNLTATVNISLHYHGDSIGSHIEHLEWKPSIDVVNHTNHPLRIYRLQSEHTTEVKSWIHDFKIFNVTLETTIFYAPEAISGCSPAIYKATKEFSASQMTNTPKMITVKLKSVQQRGRKCWLSDSEFHVDTTSTTLSKRPSYSSTNAAIDIKGIVRINRKSPEGDSCTGCIFSSVDQCEKCNSELSKTTVWFPRVALAATLLFLLLCNCILLLLMVLKDLGYCCWRSTSIDSGSSVSMLKQEPEPDTKETDESTDP